MKLLDITPNVISKMVASNLTSPGAIPSSLAEGRLPVSRCGWLDSIFETRFLVWEPDFDTRLDVLLTTQEIGGQISVRAVKFLAYCVVAWFAAVVE
jgi:hypothetical protein